MNRKINNLILELNYTCNNNCIYCYIPKNKRSIIDNREDLFFIEQLRKFRKEEVESVDFTGGEPTLYPKLTKLVYFSRLFGYKKRTLVSNGRLLAYEKVLRKLLIAGINRIVLTLDGPNSSVTQAITRTPGSYNEVLCAITNIKKAGIELGITVVVNKINYKLIPEIVGKSVHLKADFVNIQFLLPFIRDEAIPCRKLESSIIPSYVSSIRYVKQALKRFGNEMKINVHFVPFCLMRGYEECLIGEYLKYDRLVINYEGFSYNMGEHLSKGSSKLKRCDGCQYSNMCSGFFMSYKKEFGIEDADQ